MRWTVEDKLEFIKQFKKDGTVKRVDGCTPHTMLNRVKRWVAMYNTYGINGIRHNKCRSFLKEKMKGIDLINYINWYNKERIKLALKMSPIQYRLRHYN